MKFPLSWLKEYLVTSASLEEICQAINQIGLEVESCENLSEKYSYFRLAKIISVAAHPNADSLKVCQVDSGTGMLQIVCGAPNARAGISVVLAPIGSIIPANKMEIRATKIRGVESNGMLCSASELELSEDHQGIIEVNDSYKAGMSFAESFGYNDAIIDVSVTPNRGDALSIIGIARDLAAFGIGTFKPLEVKESRQNFISNIALENKFTDACQYFGAIEIRNVQNKESPDWLKSLLKKSGLKSISYIVDVTNYVAHLTGKPLHAYDADKLASQLVVRSAKNGETFSALDKRTYLLTEDDCVVASNDQVQCLAGIIGGEVSSISSDTRRIVLESALWNHVKVSFSGQRYGILTDSRYRFERKVDPEISRSALFLAANLILEDSNSEASQIIEIGNCTATIYEILFNYSDLEKISGLKIKQSDAIRILERLGFKVSVNQDILKILVPSYRPDIENKEDIVEEVLRIYGLDKVPAQNLPELDESPTTLKPIDSRVIIARRNLAAQGFDEVISYSFCDEKYFDMFSMANQEKVLLQNPISSELGMMRPSLLPNLLKMISENQRRGFNSMRIFEIGMRFNNFSDSSEQLNITGIGSGDFVERNIHEPKSEIDFYHVKAIIEQLFAAIGFNFNQVKLVTDLGLMPKYYHPGKTAVMMLGKIVLGYFGELHPKLNKVFDIKGSLVGFEIFPESIPLRRKSQKPALLLNNFQSSKRDFAFIFPKNIKAIEIIQAIDKLKINEIKDIKIFDLFVDPELSENNQISIAFSVHIQADDKTLNDNELNVISNQIISSLSLIGGIIRK